MKNFLQRLFGNRKASQKQARRERLSRQLHVERMEERQLLATDGFGAVEGTAFVDTNGNNVLDGAETGTQATVRLFNDVNGNGLLDGGDTQVGTDQITDATGAYFFGGLAAGDYLVQQDPVAGLLQAPGESVQAVNVANDAGVIGTIIDDLATANPVSAAAGATASERQAGGLNEIVGDERDVVVQNNVGSGSNLGFDINAMTGAIVIDAGVGTLGQVRVAYDGVDGDADALDHSNLNLDLTTNDGGAFLFEAGRSNPVNTNPSFLTVQVFSGDDDTFSELRIEIPFVNGGTADENILFCFDDFNQGTGATGEADFTNVTAIRFITEVGLADDISIDFIAIQNFQPVPANTPNLNPMSIGNFVFNDTDDDGVVDPGETGIQGVEVQLFEDTDANGSFTPGTDTAVAGGTATTDANGEYVFTDLLPGDYIVVIPETQFAAAGPLAGFRVSGTNFDPENNIDNDNNGIDQGANGVATAAITLAAGQEPITDGDADDNTNLSIDFGFVPEIDLSIEKTAPATVFAGNDLTYTITVQNLSNIAATNVVVIDNLPNLLPDNLTIENVTAAGGTVTQDINNATEEIRVEYATLAANSSASITVVVGIPDSAAAAAAITNIVTVEAEQTRIDHGQQSRRSSCASASRQCIYDCQVRQYRSCDHRWHDCLHRGSDQ